jgi:Zn-dependent protease
MSDLLNPPFIIAMLAALTIHEWAHAAAAYRLGDPTAKQEGRLTLNPIAHLDPLGTLLFFLVHFGWGKPVPVDPRYFRRPARDNALVALAGPLSNLVLATTSFFLLVMIAPQSLGIVSLTFTYLPGSTLQAFVVECLQYLLILNLGLMAFNLLPIAPLDGSKILEPFIPLHYQRAYDEFLRRGPMILITLLVAERILNVPILMTWISTIMTWVLSLLGFFV